MTASVKTQTLLTAGDVLLQGVALFVLYAFLLRVVGAEILGVWAIVFSVASAGKFIDIGLGRGLIRYIPLVSRTAAPVTDPDDGGPMGANSLLAGTTEDVSGSTPSRLLDAALVGTAALLIPIVVIAGAALYTAVPYLTAGRAADAMELVPWAVVLLAVGTFSNVYATTLIALFRSDLRAIVSIISTFVMLGTAVALVPSFGIVAVAWAQIGQHAVAAILALVLIKRRMPDARYIPSGVRLQDIRVLVRYGVKLHAANLAMILSEPASRLILSRFATLEAVAYYEMASRMVQQLRNIIVLSNQVIAPEFARRSGGDREGLVPPYRAALRATLLAGAPAFSALIAFAPLISFVWIGRIEPLFTVFMAVICLGWSVNTLSAPAYYVGTSTGALRTIVITHVLLAFVGLVCGPLLGFITGPVGVVVGLSSGLVLGSIYCMAAIQRQVLGCPHALFSAADLRLMVLCAAAAGLMFLALPSMIERYGLVLSVILGVALWSALTAAGLFGHPDFRRLISRRARLPATG